MNPFCGSLIGFWTFRTAECFSARWTKGLMIIVVGFMTSIRREEMPTVRELYRTLLRSEECWKSDFLSSTGRPKGKYILSWHYNLLVTVARWVFLYSPWYSFGVFFVCVCTTRLSPHLQQIPIFPDPLSFHYTFSLGSHFSCLAQVHI